MMTDKRGVIQFVNAAFEQTTGYRRNEAIGRDIHLLDSGRQGEPFFRDVRERIARQGAWSGRMVSRKKDGTLYPERCTLTPLKSASGEVIGYLSYRSDIMEHIRLETTAAEILSAKNACCVFTGIRHELGNAVNSLDITLEVLKAKLDHMERPAVMNYLDRALEHSSTLAHLLRILKTGTIFGVPELQDVRLPDFMNEFMNLVREDFTAKGIAIDVAIDEDAEFCSADPRSLYHVLLNLFINAADALKGNGRARISVNVYRQGGTVHIKVEDNGSGMTEEVRRNLFKPFYTTKPQGTGLGLALVHKFLASMNGAIDVSSRLNAGTTVDISVPAGTGAVSGVPDPSSCLM